MNFVDYLFETTGSLEKDAIAGNRETISYSNLNSHSIRLATFLDKNCAEDDPILLASDNSVFFVTVYLGILKSGRICVPINPAIPKSTLDAIVKQCHATLGFVESRFKEKFQNPDVHWLTNTDLEKLKGEGTFNQLENFDSNKVAEIIFTSGSTALPKGVMLSHKNLIANTNSIIQYLKLTSKDRIEVILPFYYCYGLSLLHTHLRAGGSMVLNNMFFMINTVIDDLLKYQCTGFAGVPSHYQLLLRKGKRFKNTEFPCLRYVTQAGGKLPYPFIEEFIESFPSIDFFVMYGQTEATARLSYLPANLVKEKPGSIGRAIPGVTLDIVDKKGGVLKAGQVGEVVASGENIMCGYYQDPELTNATIKNGKLYTGDIGKADENGYIYIVAREKEFLKVGGERISPKEIEEVIVRLPEVIDCSILGIADDTLGEAIKALIVLKDKSLLSEEGIKEYCYQNLSTNKIPKYIEIIEKIPVNAAGKKVRKNLLNYTS